ncbi:MAG TPA: acylneuraminate cytidylyltransferase [Planctomycetaceae bacterium]|nr:acylneuraminate cytidylyltransferase [Planctomycetaceae bacterium]HIQ22142.1 acylneuraminate cytidylyltransferase [Planctomycetota bacterium]
MRVVAIIQARMNSSRLPGKVLADVGGRTMLARAVRRASRARLVDHLVVATGRGEADDPVDREAGRLGAACVRGCEEDVLDRFRQAAHVARADVVVRITADCPLIDPGVIDQVIKAFLESRPDYASNTLHRSWPRGLDTEVFSTAALEEAWRRATEAYERVHVTPYLYRHPERFRLLPVAGPHQLSHWRWTVDCPDDLELVRRIYLLLGRDDLFSWHDVRRLLMQLPELAELNRHVRQKALVEG